MFELLRPDKYYSNIFEINLDELLDEGIRGLICDIDNTIVPWSEECVLEEVADWFKLLKEKGFKVFLVSNGTGNRVTYFSQELGLPAVGQAGKPTKRAFKQALEHLELSSDKLAVVGDQIFTDILGGNRMGLKTILVDPMNKKEFFITRFNRMIERLVYKRSDG